MKYISFNKLRIQNFLSVGEEPVEIEFKPGMNVITGINRDKDGRTNGVGKSTIADALFFVLFGRTLRELKKELIVNNITNSTCAVSITFTVSESNNTTTYRVLRQINPTRCELYKDDNDVTLDTIKNTTDKICNIIQATPDIFENCVLMTINNAVPFMAKKKNEKRQFIESIFNLGIFSNMLAHARNDYNDKSHDLDNECGKYEEISNSLQSHITQRSINTHNLDKRKTELTERKSQNTNEIHDIIDKLKNLPDVDTEALGQKKNDITIKRDALIDVRQSLSEKISVNKALIEQLSTNYKKIGTKDEACPVCLRPFSEHDKERVDLEKRKIQEDIDSKKNQNVEVNSKIRQLDKALESLKVKRDSISREISESIANHEFKKNAKEQVNKLRQSSVQLDDDINQLASQYNSFDSIITEVEGKLSQKEKDISSLKDNLNILDIVKFVMSEEGVKSYIVNKILQIFNSKIAYYLQKLESNCVCVFNEYFEEQIINEKGIPCSYFNFSGAERKTIDLACLFAFMDIRRLQGNVTYNISLYDELLDSSFDERGVDLVIHILIERVNKYNESIVIISHRKESVKISSHYKNSGEVIYLEKTGGITKRVDFIESTA